MFNQIALILFGAVIIGLTTAHFNAPWYFSAILGGLWAIIAMNVIYPIQ